MDDDQTHLVTLLGDDEFMQAVVSDGDHALKGHDGSVVEVVKAKPEAMSSVINFL